MKVIEEIKSKLQKGKLDIPLSNDLLMEFFENDLKEKGIEDPIVHHVPDKEISFVFYKIEGNTQAVQVFLYTGCNTAIVEDGIPPKEFDATLLRPGLMDIDVATGIKVCTNGE